MNPKDKILPYLKDHPGAFVSVVQQGTGMKSRTETIRLLNELAESGTIVKTLKDGKASYTLDDPDMFTDITNGEIDWQHLTFEKNNKFENEYYSLILPDQFEICEEDDRDFAGRYTVDNDEVFANGLQILPGARISEYDSPFSEDIKNLIDADFVITLLETGYTSPNKILNNAKPQFERVSIGNTEGLIQTMEILPDEMYLNLCNGTDSKLFTFKFYGLGLDREQQKNLIFQIMATFHDKNKRESKDIFNAANYEEIPKDNFFLSIFEEDLENASKTRQVKTALNLNLNNRQLQQKIDNGEISTSTQLNQWVNSTLPVFLQKQVQKSADYISQAIDYYQSIQWEDENAEVQRGWEDIARFIQKRRYHQIDMDDEIIPYFSQKMEDLLIDKVLPHLIPEKEIDDEYCRQLEQELDQERRDYEEKLAQHNQKAKDIQANKALALDALEEKHKKRLLEDIEQATAEYTAQKNELNLSLQNIENRSEQIQKELDSLGLFNIFKKNKLQKELDTLAKQGDNFHNDQKYLEEGHTAKLTQLKMTNSETLNNEKIQLDKEYLIPEPPIFQGTGLEKKVHQAKQKQAMQNILAILSKNEKPVSLAELAEKAGTQDTASFQSMLDILKNRKYVKTEAAEDNQKLYKSAFQENTFSLSKPRLNTWIPEYLFSRGGKATMKELENAIRPKLWKSDLNTDLLALLRQLENQKQLILSSYNGQVYCMLTQEGLSGLDLSVQDSQNGRISRKRTDHSTLKKWIREIIYNARYPLSISEIARGLADYGEDISNQKTAALVSLMVKDGQINKSLVDKVARFSKS